MGRQFAYNLGKLHVDTYIIYKNSLHIWAFDLKKIYNPTSGDNF